MLRSRHIPPVLSRVTGDGIHTALLLTADGDLLGAYTTKSSPPDLSDEAQVTKEAGNDLDVASISALVAEVTGDYKRAGHELSFLRGPQRTSQPTAYPLKCLLLEMEFGMLGIASTAAFTSTPSRADCYVAAIADSSLHDCPGLLKARISACAGHIGEALLQLAEPP